MRAPTILLATLLLLTILPPPLAASPLPAPDPWNAMASAEADGGLGALSHYVAPVVENGAIAVTADGTFLRNLQFPRDANNTFLQTTGGGQVYALRHGGQVTGMLHGGLAYEGFAALDDGSAVTREASSDGNVSIVTQVSAATDNASAIGITYWVRNNGDAPIEDLKIYLIAEPNANSQDTETTTMANGVIASTNDAGAQAILGFAPCGTSAGHAIGDYNVLEEVLSDELNGATSYTGDSWLVQAQAAPALGAGEVASFQFVMRADANGGSVADAASFCPAAAAQPPVDFLVPTPPAAPTNLTATGVEGGIALDWEDATNPANSTYYIIYRGDSACEAMSVADYVFGETSYHDAYFLDGGVTYCYHVTAYDATYGFESAPSNTATATPISGIDLELAWLGVYTGSPLSSGTVDVAFTNSGTRAAYAAEVYVTVCPAAFGTSCHEIGRMYVSEFAPGAWADARIQWDTAGMVGDFVVCAYVESPFDELDADLSNNERCEQVTVTAPGFGVGIDLRH